MKLRSTKLRISVFNILAGSSLLALASAADAQTASGPSATATTSFSLEEIVVTARRRSEVLQDVPQSVSAISSNELQKLNLQNLTDLSSVVPGLQIVATSGGFNNNDTLRGVTFNPSSGTQNTVAFYLNDTFVTNNFVSTSNFDVGQIEVLKGPQGTLRGEPGPSGSLTITTHRPDLEQFGGYVTGTGSNLSAHNGNAAVNLPLVKGVLALRLAGIVNDNDYDGVRSVNNPDSPFSFTTGERASIRFEPSDVIEANVVYQHVFSHVQSFPQVEGPGSSGGTFAPIAPPAGRSGYFAPATLPADYNGPPIDASQRLGVQTLPNTLYTTTDIVTAQLDWHFLGQILSYDGSYWKYAINNGDGANVGNQVPGITASNPIPREPSQFTTPSTTQYTHSDELRLSSETPIFGLMDYTAGAFYRNTKNQVDVVQVASFLGGSFGTPLAPANPSIYNSRYTLQLLIQSPAEEEEHSGFLHLTFHLPRDTELAVGGRYLDYKKTGYTRGDLLPQNTFTAIPVAAGTCGFLGGQFGATYANVCDAPIGNLLPSTVALPQVQQDLKDHDWIYNVSLSHKFSPDFLVYVNSGSSWRPPGVAVGINNAANDPELTALSHVNTERSYSYEAGFKSTFLENRARLNVALFHQKYDGFIYYGQPIAYLADNGAGANVAQFAFTSNPDAVLNGVDLDAGFRFTKDWSFDLTASYANGHLTGSPVPCSPPGVANPTPASFPAGTHIFLCPSNASLSTAPNFNFSAQSEYDMPVPGLTEVNGFVRGLYVFSGSNPHVSPVYQAPSYGLFNLFAGLRSSDDAWEVSLFAKNALNTQKVLYKAPFAYDTNGLSELFGSSGYFSAVFTPLVTPRREIGLTVTYSFGSR